MPSLQPLDRLRKPEHTGTNRCLPCTVVNVVLSVVLTSAVALVAVELAFLVLGLCLLAIYLRGYVVPYTPTLTTRYLPESVLLAFGKEPTPEPADTDATWDAVEELEAQRARAVDADAYLLDAEVLDRTGDDASEYRWTDAFANRVDAHLDDVDESVDEESVASLFDADVDEVTDQGREYPAYKVGIRIRKWPSEAALRVDLAAHRALAERGDDWLDVPVDQRTNVLALLRRCRTECPICGGSLSETNETVESCCVNVEKYAISCDDCENHLREYDDPTKLDRKGLTGV